MNQIDGVLKNKRGEIIMPQTIIRQVEGLDDALNIIKADIQALQNSGGGGGGSDPVPDIGTLPEDVSQLQSDVENLRSDLNRTVTNIEDVRNSIRQTESELSGHISSADLRYNELDNRLFTSASELQSQITVLMDSILIGVRVDGESVHVEDHHAEINLFEKYVPREEIPATELVLAGVRVDGESVPVTDHFAEINLSEKYVLREEMPVAPTNTEIWTFTLESGEIVSKEVYIKW
jgi:hypothetical protein